MNCIQAFLYALFLIAVVFYIWLLGNEAGLASAIVAWFIWKHRTRKYY